MRRSTTGPWPSLLAALTSLLILALSPTVASAQTSAGPLYGVTIDNIGQIKTIVSAESRLPNRPTTRVYFDVSEPASYYRVGVSDVASVSNVMGELLDSSDATRITTSAFQTRVESFLSTLGSAVTIWEVGNEVNGNWTGPYSDGSAKLTEAYADVAAQGATAALTLYANEFGPDNCGDGVSELTPAQYSEQYVPTSVRDGLAYVFESYYPTQCQNTYPSNTQVAAEMRELHALYPNALLGFGETGLPHPATRRTLATAERVMSWAYDLNPGLPYYVGGYFWWYARQDAFRHKKLLASQLAAAFRSETFALQ
ncbi:MAG: hypothetical protein ABSC30_07010 [Acidimicrobiales bacterium]|jgi:hypothetical protein